MNRLILFASSFVLLSADAARASDVNAEQLLHRVVARYRAMRTLQADIVVTTSFGSEKRTVNGTLKMKKPVFFRLATKAPHGALIVANQSNIYMYTKRDNQSTTMPATGLYGAVYGSTSNFGIALFFETSQYPFKGMGKPAITGKRKLDGVECTMLRFTRPSSDITLFVQPDLLVRQSVMVFTRDKAASSSETSTLHNLVVDNLIADNAFTFTPPKTVKTNGSR